MGDQATGPCRSGPVALPRSTQAPRRGRRYRALGVSPHAPLSDIRRRTESSWEAVGGTNPVSQTRVCETALSQSTVSRGDRAQRGIGTRRIGGAHLTKTERAWQTAGPGDVLAAAEPFAIPPGAGGRTGDSSDQRGADLTTHRRTLLRGFHKSVLDGAVRYSLVRTGQNKERPARAVRGVREEPTVGFEPTTCSLRVSCSTPELRWRRLAASASGSETYAPPPRSPTRARPKTP